MVGPWKLYIDSRQKRAFDFCYGSLTEGNGFGSGFGFGNGSGGARGGRRGSGARAWGDGYGCIDPDGYGTAHGGGWGDGYGNGGSPEEWK